MSNSQISFYQFTFQLYAEKQFLKNRKRLYFETSDVWLVIPPLDGSHSEMMRDGWFEET